MSRTASDQDLMDKRAEILATLLMTARDDVRPVRADDADSVADQLYRVAVGKPGLRYVGVALKATLKLRGGAEAVRRAARSVRPVTAYPVVLFYFAVQENAAWYAWAASPVVQNGRAVLATHVPDAGRLDADAIDGIVTSVDNWYDMLYASLAAGPAPNSRPDR